MQPAVQPPTEQRHPDDTPANKRGLVQAYKLRDIAAHEAYALHAAEAVSLADKVARAKALQALGNLWVTACDRVRVFKGRGLPKSVVAANDPSRKASRPRSPITPIPVPVPAPSSTGTEQGTQP